MKEEINKEDELLKTLFAKSAVKPGSDLTEKVMVRIDQSSDVFAYKPLISKKSWILMGSAFAMTMIYLIVSSERLVVQTPELISLLSDSLTGFMSSFHFEWSIPKLPAIPAPLLISLVAFNVIGIYLMVYFKWLHRSYK